jgi:digeranylgeranylglycerophospholipid reductase
MERLFETIIIGAGPAGLTAGRYLKDCLILEQKEEIGKPIQCGEGLSKRFLDRYGIKPDPNWISASVDNTQIVLPNKKTINFIAKGELFIIDRTNFEKFLASRCRAKIQLKKRVIDIKKEKGIWEIKTKEGEIFKSKYLIGADGPFSITRKKVFKKEIRILPCIEYLVELEKEINISEIKIYFDKEKLPSGYAWIFPKSKHSANIGLGIVGKGNLNLLFKDFLENTVKREFGNFELLENKSGPVPWEGSLIKMVKDNTFLVGDAAGLVNPISGGGIGNAMISGEMAANSILSGKIDSYESKIKSLPDFSDDLFLAQRILYSFSNQTFNEIGEVLEKVGGDIFHFKNPQVISAFLSKPNLRKNISKFLKLYSIYKKYKDSYGKSN